MIYVQCARFHTTLMNMRKMGKSGYSVVVVHGCTKTARQLNWKKMISHFAQFVQKKIKH